MVAKYAFSLLKTSQTNLRYARSVLRCKRAASSKSSVGASSRHRQGARREPSRSSGLATLVTLRAVKLLHRMRDEVRNLMLPRAYTYLPISSAVLVSLRTKYAVTETTPRVEDPPRQFARPAAKSLRRHPLHRRSGHSQRLARHPEAGHYWAR